MFVPRRLSHSGCSCCSRHINISTTQHSIGIYIFLWVSLFASATFVRAHRLLIHQQTRSVLWLDSQPYSNSVLTPPVVVSAATITITWWLLVSWSEVNDWVYRLLLRITYSLATDLDRWMALLNYVVCTWLGSIDGVQIVSVFENSHRNPTPISN